MKKLAMVLAFLFLLGGFGCEEINQEPEVETMEQAIIDGKFDVVEGDALRVINKESYFYGETGIFKKAEPTKRGNVFVLEFDVREFGKFWLEELAPVDSHGRAQRSERENRQTPRGAEIDGTMFGLTGRRDLKGMTDGCTDCD